MTLARCGSTFGLFVFLTTANSAQATTFMAGATTDLTPLARIDVYSKSQAFVLDVNPAEQINTVYASGDRTRPLWSFPGVLKTNVRQILLAESGSVVALIFAGEANTDDPSAAEGVRLLDQDGATLSYPIGDFIRNPPLSFGCGSNAVRWFEEVIDRGDGLVIRTSNGKQYLLGYSTSRQVLRWFTPVTVSVGVGAVILLFLIRSMYRRPRVVPPAEANP